MLLYLQVLVRVFDMLQQRKMRCVLTLAELFNLDLTQKVQYHNQSYVRSGFVVGYLDQQNIRKISDVGHSVHCQKYQVVRERMVIILLKKLFLMLVYDLC
eukprot:TRINITY_DN2473_c0_g1_i3.p2 TRINITY_DN2473_c0_g1~~TRINITY_DN2473_c0_g1_i3.p2  ORF type:complete len:100 (-),score=0.84 TRINITY_DN2473_c0_g1_i3:115-414(-)